MGESTFGGGGSLTWGSFQGGGMNKFSTSGGGGFSHHLPSRKYQKEERGRSLMKIAKKYDLVIINKAKKSERYYALECKLKKDQY